MLSLELHHSKKPRQTRSSMELQERDGNIAMSVLKKSNGTSKTSRQER
jgi:hypothetical protein